MASHWSQRTELAWMKSDQNRASSGEGGSGGVWILHESQEIELTVSVTLINNTKPFIYLPACFALIPYGLKFIICKPSTDLQPVKPYIVLHLCSVHCKSVGTRSHRTYYSTALNGTDNCVSTSFQEYPPLHFSTTKWDIPKGTLSPSAVVYT